MVASGDAPAGVPSLDRRPVTESRSVYRFVHVESESDDPPAEDFRSDREAGRQARSAREKAYPELLDGMSVFGSLDAARRRWADVHAIAIARGERVRLGDHIAEVVLDPEGGYMLEDLHEPDEHLTLWGDPVRLAAAVERLYSAATPAE